jgi:lipopolysaccharide transport system ATP-binding protein
MQSIIQVENLGKKYRLGESQGARYTALRDVIAERFKSAASSLAGVSKKATAEKPEFWALKNVNFDIQPGERVGIIGRNGAGKSTLLKVLSRITSPTTGKITLRGRLASLLEVGTGFHPELTGRENIYLNGAILGMNRPEIARKFDEIVAFAEVERFLDTPVKRYSSGMYVRLAFAVAAHLEPEILIVDEVLAVGDAQFQKKCLGKMEDVGREGRTVLFVSHDIRAVKTLCTYGIVMTRGTASPKSLISEAIDMYAKAIKTNDIGLPLTVDELTFQEFRVTQYGIDTVDLNADDPVDVLVRYSLSENVKNFRIGIYLKTMVGEQMFRSLIADWHPEREDAVAGEYTAKLRIPARIVHGGTYVLGLAAARHEIRNYLHQTSVEIQVNILGPEAYNINHLSESLEGTIVVNEAWTLEKDA